MTLTNEQVEQYINKIKEVINEAQKELGEVKTITENDPTEYSHVMRQLQQLNEEMGEYLVHATSQQQKNLLEAREYIHHTQELMTRGI